MRHLIIKYLFLLNQQYLVISIFYLLILTLQSNILEAHEYKSRSKVHQNDLILKRIEINEATLEELCSLPRIGVKKAERIIEYRKRYRFTRITQLLNIQGIGRKTLKNFRHMIYIRPKIKK